MTYEAWRISYQSAEQAARAAYNKVEELAAQLASIKPAEAIAWRLKPCIDPCGLVRYMTQRMFEQQTPGVQRWYEPYRCANCSTSTTKASVAAPVRLTTAEIVDALRGAGLYEDGRAFQRLFPTLEADARLIEAAVHRKLGINDRPAGDSAYGPDNPPRLRRPDESVEDYRAAMGWSNPGINEPAEGGGA